MIELAVDNININSFFNRWAHPNNISMNELAVDNINSFITSCPSKSTYISRNLSLSPGLSLILRIIDSP